MGKSSGLCPVATGLALGLTCGLSVFACMYWVKWFGMSPETMMGHLVRLPADFTEALIMAGHCLLKGFVFGFVFALLYDWISCCTKSWCGKKSCTMGCGCGNPNCHCNGKSAK